MWSKAILRIGFRFFLLVLLLLAPLGAEERRLFLLHTNDIHGHIEAYEKGGLTRAASVIKLFRQAFPGQVVLLDGGDTSLGTPLSGNYFGKPTAELMAHLRYDAITVGNHEFNWGKEKMRALTDTMSVPVLCANLVTKDGSPAPYAGYTIVDRNGIKLAIIGLVTPDTYRRAPVEATEGWEFLESAHAVRTVLPTIEEDYDLLISLNHIGVKADRKLARAVPEIDLIVGGHSHTPLHQAVYENDIPIVQAGCYAQFIGLMELLVDTQNDRFTLLNYHLIPLTQETAIDPVAESMVETYAAELRPYLEKEIAQVTGLIGKGPVGPHYDTPLGNLIADVFREQAETDIAFYNRGGVRFDMEPGPLTVEGVHKLFPFDDPVVVLEATGEQIRQIVEQGSVGGEGPLSPSGLTAVIQDDRVAEIRIDGAPLRRDHLYTVATTHFLAGGGDGMSTFTPLQQTRRLPFTRDVLLAFLEAHNSLEPPLTGRFRKD